MFRRFIFLFTVSVITSGSALSQEPQYALTEPLKLWYTEPAANWNEALPVGNGRLGGMFFGGINEERIQLNEESVWSGGKEDFVNPDAKKNLALVRELLFEGQYAEAQRLAQANLMGNKTKPSSYQTLGDLTLRFKHDKPATDYTRELDIEKAIGKVQYKSDGILYTREIFSSAVDQVLVMRISSDKPGALSFRLNLTRPGDKAEIKVASNSISLSEHVGDSYGVKLFSKVTVLTKDGSVSPSGNSLEIAGATEAIIYLAANTNYRGKDEVAATENQLDKIAKKPVDDIVKQHIADYRSYFSRMNLVLVQPVATRFAYVNFPTNERLAAVRRGNVDPHLLVLYYHFGRYLLISSSRPGSLPANLQGI
jgi:alpha-L-fucosidase 2